MSQHPPSSPGISPLKTSSKRITAQASPRSHCRNPVKILNRPHKKSFGWMSGYAVPIFLLPVYIALQIMTHIMCTALHIPFHPPSWCSSGNKQTIGGALMRKLPRIHYKREILELADGGAVGVDWAGEAEPGKPIVLLLPGLTSDSEENYIRGLVASVRERGFPVAILNYRGNGGIPLRTPRFYCAANTDDFRELVMYVRQSHPTSPLLACGVSLGGLILFNYVAAHPNDTHLRVAVTVSMPWDNEASSSYLESSRTRLLMNQNLARGLVKKSFENEEFLLKLPNIDMEALRQVKVIRDYDREVTCPMFGYESVEEYYSAATPAFKLDRVTIPLLNIIAKDDPFVPASTIPTQKVAEATNGLVLLVLEHGGHIGFIDTSDVRFRSPFPSVRETYIDRLVGDLLETLQDFELLKT